MWWGGKITKQTQPGCHWYQEDGSGWSPCRAVLTSRLSPSLKFFRTLVQILLWDLALVELKSLEQSEESCNCWSTKVYSILIPPFLEGDRSSTCFSTPPFYPCGNPVG
ncbi:UNVERIFIED_CONTAM: hypothetical protein K2H54_039643 [Gekko kuhli]